MYAEPARAMRDKPSSGSLRAQNALLNAAARASHAEGPFPPPLHPSPLAALAASYSQPRRRKYITRPTAATPVTAIATQKSVTDP